MEKSTYFKLAGVTLVLSVVTSVIMLIPNWNGFNGSTEADQIDTLLDVMIVLSSFVFAVVMVALVYGVWRYRAKPGDESDGEPIHGNTRLEIAWTVIPTVIVLFCAGYSWVILDDIEAREPDRLEVDVTGQQFKWTFEYPEEGVTSNELHVVVNRQAAFEMTGLDVLHSFWVPEWRVKKDLVPGITTDVAATPDREGSYSLVCTEYCGAGHATMRAPVVVETEEEFADWVADQEKIAEGDEGLPVIESEFNKPVEERAGG
ncbi:MAG: cytochrome c oxidase subunit II [Solirubrobacterales bacterium]